MAIYFTQNTNNVEDIEQMNNVIDKVNQANTTATSNIGQLTDLNNKAQELSNDIQQALPINTELKENIKIGQPLVQEATTKNTELQASLEKTKEFINGLDGSQNIPQIRLDVDALQNGLKSNQALAYQGSSISANDTLEGRTEGMRIGGRTLVNLVNIRKMILSKETTFEDDIIKFRKTGSDITYLQIPFLSKPNTTYTIVYTIVKNTVEQPDEQNYILYPDGVLGDFYSTMNTFPKNGQIGLNKICLNSKSTLFGTFSLGFHRVNVGAEIWIENLMILEGDWTNKEIPSFFEGLKSFGEVEKVEDKYKISILSHGKNLFNFKSIKEEAFDNNSIKLLENGLRIENHWAKSIDFKIDLKPNTKYTSSYNYKVIKDAVNPTDTGGGKLMLHNESTGKYFALTNPKGVGMTFTTPEDIKDYKKIILYSAGGGGSYRGIVEITNIQIEEGTQATQCEPYKCDKKDILIKEPLREGDYLYEDNGQVKVYRDVKQYTFTGDENISIRGEVKENTMSFAYAVKNNKSNALLCNNFKVLGGWDKDEERIWLDGTNLMFHIQKSKLTTPDVNGFKAWLKANPTTIVYQLATPTVEIVENCVDIDLDTFGEKTYFNILNSLPGTLDFKVPSNIASIVQNTAREVNNIWDVINNLLVPSLIDINKNVAMSTIKNNLK
ncbi:BppU family phage baseplate upper protein [Clostridium perfringens]